MLDARTGHADKLLPLFGCHQRHLAAEPTVGRPGLWLWQVKPLWRELADSEEAPHITLGSLDKRAEASGVKAKGKATAAPVSAPTTKPSDFQPQAPSTSSDDSGLSTGEIIIIVVVGLVALGLAVVGIMMRLKHGDKASGRFGAKVIYERMF